MRVSHLTPLLCAAARRSRGARATTGSRRGFSIGFAVAMKFFAWPLGLWLALERSLRRGARARRRIGGASLLLVLPFTPLDDYVRVLLQLGRGFDQDAYTIFGLVVQCGRSETAGRIATFAVGAALLAATWRYRSFTLALAAALVLSPIVWLDYFAVAAVPLADRPPAALARSGSSPSRRGGCEGAGHRDRRRRGLARGAARLPRRVRDRVRDERRQRDRRRRASARAGRTDAPGARLADCSSPPGAGGSGGQVLEARRGPELASRAAPGPRLAARSAPSAPDRGSGPPPSGTRPSRGPSPSGARR